MDNSAVDFGHPDPESVQATVIAVEKVGPHEPFDALQASEVHDGDHGSATNSSRNN